MLLIIITQFATWLLNKFLYSMLIETNQSGIENSCLSNVKNAFLITRITFVFILFIYVLILYLIQTRKMNYSIWLIVCMIYLFIKYKIEIGACKLIEHLFNVKFYFGSLQKIEWEELHYLGSIRVNDGKFWVIWQPSKNKIEVIR